MHAYKVLSEREHPRTRNWKIFAHVKRLTHTYTNLHTEIQYPQNVPVSASIHNNEHTPVLLLIQEHLNNHYRNPGHIPQPTVRPLWVKMQGENKALSAGGSYGLVCEVAGSRPKPVITWWKGSILMKNSSDLVRPTRAAISVRIRVFVFACRSCVYLYLNCPSVCLSVCAPVSVVMSGWWVFMFVNVCVCMCASRAHDEIVMCA